MFILVLPLYFIICYSSSFEFSNSNNTTTRSVSTPTFQYHGRIKTKRGGKQRTSKFSFINKNVGQQHTTSQGEKKIYKNSNSVFTLMMAHNPTNDHQKSIDSDSSSKAPNQIVIAGAGVIGTSTAYYLSKLAATNQQYTAASPLRITLVDITGRIAPAASGKAGGFLALNWNDYSPVGKLARRSFALHEHLASSDELGSESIMYRRLTSASISIAERNERGKHTLMKKPSGKKLEGIEWVHPSNNHDDLKQNPTDNAELVTQTVRNNNPSCDIDVVGIQILGDESTIAQVHPKMLCDSMWEAIQKNPHVKSNLIKGQIVDSVHDNDDGSLIGAKLLDGTILDADAILYACGPWTKQGNCMLGVKYHSVIIPTSKVLNQSVFFDGLGDPEVYPRPDSTAYCTGFPDDAITVTERPGEEEVRDEAVHRIVNTLRKASGGINGALGKDPELKQSCYLPTTLDGVPIIGPLSKKKNCFIAAGHGCWGILLGPATGEAMASLIMNGCSTKYVDLSLFRPDRFSI